MTKDKQTLIKELNQVNNEIDQYNKTLIKMLQIIKCDSIDWYNVKDKVEYLKTKKHLILFQLASK